MLYGDAGRMVGYLSEWNCSKTLLEECIVSLAEDFALNGFWEKSDVYLAKEWVDDLKKLNYTLVLSTFLE